MRIVWLIPLAVAAVGAAGCRASSSDPETTAFQVPQRDLTLQQAEAPQLDVASPVELGRTAPAERRGVTLRSKSRHAAPAMAPSPTAAEPAVGDVPVMRQAAGSAPTPVSPASYQPPDPYALAPGQTVTVLPATTGPANAPAPADEGLPEAQRGDSRGVTIRGGGHGGSCGGRGGHGGGAGPGFRGLR